MKAEALFDGAAKAKVAAAVASAESRSLGQIVPAVVDQSSEYHGQLIAAAVMLSAGLAIGTVLEPGSLRVLGWSLSSVVWVPLVALAFVPGFAKLFVRRQFESAVRLRALAAFTEHGLSRTKGETGVLIFASLYERKVVVLGDRAIHEKMGDAGWREAVDALVAAMGQGDPAEGFCKAIALVGAKLAAEFPRTEGAPRDNELPDALQIER